jgi:hypothetical protein
MPMLNEEDHALSRKTTAPTNNPDRRQPLVGELRSTYKAVKRGSFFCEACWGWKHVGRLSFPSEWICPTCGAEYRIEAAIYRCTNREWLSE